MSHDSSGAIETSPAESDDACPACTGPRAPLGRKSGHLLWRCRRCGTVFIGVEAPAAEELYAHYYDAARFEPPGVVAAALERLVRGAEPFRSTGRWLDVGYGEGGLLQVAQARGWRCYGTEVSASVLDYGARQGWVVAPDTGDSRFPPGGFDVVTMIELLEHVPRPRRFLEEALRLLRTGGLLYVTTPNALSLNRRLLGLDWSIFSPPEHLTIWTPKGLRHALALSGFRPTRVRTEGLNPCEVLARLRSGRGRGRPVNRNEAAVALSTALSRSALRRALKAGINHGLSLLRIGDTLKAWAVREGAGP